MNWYITVLKKYAVFTGRARRKEYWMFFLFNLIFAANGETFGERISPKIARGLREFYPMWDTIRISRSPSVMRQLFVALWSNLVQLPIAQARPQELSDSDWRHDIAWAQERAGGTEDLMEARALLIKGLKYCRYCWAPLLAGCRINDVRISARRDYCDTLCGKRYKRGSC